MRGDMVTSEQLRRLFPTAKDDLVSAVVDNWTAAEKAGITTPKRIAMFLANIGHETGGLRLLSEGLNYTSVAQIRKTWPTRFKSDTAALPFVRNERGLANKVYNGRMGNRNNSDDGYDYRGGGMMQTTGRDGYRSLGYEDNPKALRDPDTAFLTAVREWAKRGCNELADADDLTTCRKRINGGTIGLAKVKTYYQKALPIFAAAKPAPVRPAASKPVVVDSSTIASVQRSLRVLGYPEVGDPDGKMGSKTNAGILAFRADNGLPLTTDIDTTLLAAIMAAKPREIEPSRANATAKELKPQSSVIRSGDKLVKGGLGLLGGSAVLGGGDILDQVQKARSIYDTVSDILPWLLLAAAGAVAIYYGQKVIRARVQAYREGRSL